MLNRALLHKIRFKVICGISTILGIALIGLGYLTITEQRQLLFQNIRNQGEQMAAYLVESSADPIRKYRFFQLQDLAIKVERSPLVAFCEIYDDQGESLVQTETTIKGEELVKKIRQTGKNILLIEKPIYVEETLLGNVEIGLYLDEVYQEITNTTTQWGLAFLIITGVVAFMLNLFISVLFVSPIITLSQLTTTIVQGQFMYTGMEQRQDEIGELARSFVDMQQAIQRKLANLRAVNHLAERMVILRDQREAFNTALRVIRKHTNMTRSSVWLLSSNQELELQTFYPVSREQPPRTRRVKLGEGVIGRIAQQPYLLYIPDTSKEPDHRCQTLQEDHPAAKLYVPMLDQDRVMGIMVFSGAIGKACFHPEDEEFLLAIARVTVITIHNIQMISIIEAQNKELFTKNDMLQAEIEERKQMQIALQQAKEAAEAANRVKSEFLATMSHEIRTPMTAILGMAELLWESELTPEQQQYVQTFRHSSETLLQILNNILDLRNIETGRLEMQEMMFDLPATLSTICRLFRPQAQAKQLHLTCELRPGIPNALSGDPARLQQILGNLLDNAIKFTSAGEIAVTVCPAESMQSLTQTETITLQFAVRDTGIGILQDKQTRIFECFTQVDGSSTRAYSGAGLGLALCQQLVTLLGGQIWVESEPGKGSTFFFTAQFHSSDEPATPVDPQEPITRAAQIPIPAGTEPIQVLPPTQAEPSTGRPLRILLVEDTKNNQMLFCHYLKETPHQVEIAENGQIGVEKYTTGSYDVVFMDLEMPMMDGYEATKVIRQWEREHNRAAVPIIILTAHALKGTEQEVMAIGCTAFMTKPFKKEMLLETLQKFVL